MATQRKGCGFLITALILVIIMAVAMGIGVYSGMKSLAPISSFTTPNSGEITPDDDTAISVWLHGNDTSIPTGIDVLVTDVETGKISSAPLTKMESNIEVNGDRRILLSSFKAEKGKNYKIRVTGLEEGRKISLAKSTLAGFGLLAGGMGISCPCAILALIFGIIGLIKFFGSKNNPSQLPPSPASPAA